MMYMVLFDKNCKNITCAHPIRFGHMNGGGGGGEGGDKTVLKLQKIDKGRIFVRIRSAVLLVGVHVVWQGLVALVKFTHGNNYITILQ